MTSQTLLTVGAKICRKKNIIGFQISMNKSLVNKKGENTRNLKSCFCFTVSLQHVFRLIQTSGRGYFIERKEDVNKIFKPLR